MSRNSTATKTKVAGFARLGGSVRPPFSDKPRYNNSLDAPLTIAVEKIFNPLVFTTAYDDHAVTAFELEALDYMLKPFGRERFRQMLARVKLWLFDYAEDSEPSVRERALSALKTKPVEHLQRLFVRDRRGRLVQVRAAEITRLVGADDYVELHVGPKSYLVKVTLNEFDQRLDPNHFRRIHRSAIVNLDHVVSCKPIDRRLCLKLSDGSEVVASRTGSQTLRDLFL